MLFEILRHTPTWVWIVLAFLLYRGVAATQPRDISPSRALIVPVVFFVWGASSLFAAADGPALKIGLFVGALIVGLVVGRALASLAAPPRLSRDTGLMAMPGSLTPLILIVVAFAVKYTGSVALALATDVVARAELSSALAASGGLFAGIFWGRTLGQFQRALRADGQQVTLATLVGLVTGPAGANAPERLS